MSLDMVGEQKEHRPIGWSLLGLLIVIGAGVLFFDALRSQSATAPLPTAYQYKVTQDVNTDISYYDSSFYNGGPGQNTA